MVKQLHDELVPFLKQAKTLYIASALVNKAGFNFIENHLPADCIRNYLVGIDLPTHPDVLEELMNASLGNKRISKVYHSEKTFHPKVYIIGTDEKKLTAFVGSANTTNGGLSRNIEMSVQINDQQQCKQLIEWFEELFSHGFDITRQFLDKYIATYRRIKVRNAANYSDVTNITNNLHSPSAQIRSGQFFESFHFDAYQETNWFDYSDPANQNRKVVKENFKRLHNNIYNEFSQYALSNLSCHYHTQNIVSSHLYRKGFNKSKLDAIWLQYGYFGENGVMLDHPRVQVILKHNYIGIWFVIGKDNGSANERYLLKENMQNSEHFRTLFYKNLRELGGAYWVSMGKDEPQISEIENSEDLNILIQNDNLSNYFIIGRDYDPSDDSLSESNIVETVLGEFQRLYPIYDLIREKNT